MKSLRILSAAALAFSLVATGVLAQTKPAPADGYKPEVGQDGKDVIWVPTPQTLVDRMLDIAKVTPKDFLMDLGSGDGRTVITAAKRGVRAMGIEYNPDMVAFAKDSAQKAGVADKAEFQKADLFETDFSKATVITMFLLTEINMKLRPKILDLKAGTRIVSNTFTMGEWKHDGSVRVKEGCTSYCTAYLWIVPAKVAGDWKLGEGTLSLKQEFQMLTGTLTIGGKATPITNARMNGARISFSAGGTSYTGQVDGGKMMGTSKAGADSSKWSAAKAG